MYTEKPERGNLSSFDEKKLKTSGAGSYNYSQICTKTIMDIDVPTFFSLTLYA